MRYIYKLLVLPVILILSLLKLFLEGVTKAYCLVAGVAINILIICAALAVATGQWFALGVFAVLFVGILFVLLCAGTISVLLDNMKDKLRRV